MLLGDTALPNVKADIMLSHYSWVLPTEIKSLNTVIRVNHEINNDLKGVPHIKDINEGELRGLEFFNFKHALSSISKELISEIIEQSKNSDKLDLSGERIGQVKELINKFLNSKF